MSILSLLFLAICIGVSMWYLAWKKTAVWGAKGFLLGVIIYVTVALLIPFAFKVLAALIPAAIALTVIALFIGFAVFVWGRMSKARR